VTTIRQEFAEAKDSWLSFDRTAQTQRATLDKEHLERVAEIEEELQRRQHELTVQREAFESMREAMELATSDCEEALAATERLRTESDLLRQEMDKHVEKISDLSQEATTLRSTIQDLQRKEQALVERLQMLHRQQLRTAS
jgi:chromosome segregation ATPase